jgi:hypothetical protein
LQGSGEECDFGEHFGKDGMSVKTRKND